MNLKIWQFFLLFSLPFWQLLKIPFLLPALPEANFYFGDLLALIASSLFLVNFKKQPQKLKKIDKCFLAFGGTATLSLLFNLSSLEHKEALVAFFYLLRLWSFICICSGDTDIQSNGLIVFVFTDSQVVKTKFGFTRRPRLSRHWCCG